MNHGCEQLVRYPDTSLDRPAWPTSAAVYLRKCARVNVLTDAAGIPVRQNNAQQTSMKNCDPNAFAATLPDLATLVYIILYSRAEERSPGHQGGLFLLCPELLQHRVVDQLIHRFEF
ncbi:MAG: hypothetical protein M3Y57_03725 [Acidobacteriota bacterium]|nr:hypothetical protein [Acidobacteriota bacterium]